MIKVFQIAMQTVLGWTVATCSISADIPPTVPNEPPYTNFVCIADVAAEKYIIRGRIYRVTGQSPTMKFNDL